MYIYGLLKYLFKEMNNNEKDKKYVRLSSQAGRSKWCISSIRWLIPYFGFLNGVELIGKWMSEPRSDSNQSTTIVYSQTSLVTSIAFVW